MKMDDGKFPVGLRVLVVDDDPTCLKLMESLLLKCQYVVTTTSQAKEALRMLKKNKNSFDLVISDVHMPDMDGFKLLHIVALEMDLPVIMLSAYGEPKLVMTGIKYGACDYLLKPVRIQELQNIWQHVVRRNKSAMLRKPASVPTTTTNATQPRVEEDGQENNAGSDNCNDPDGQEEAEENDSESQDQTTQKKPRLFWSPDLHQKFVDAVDQLSIEKAFPKKILDLMNVEGLTREQVASHLQKYRVYLRKMNSPASHRASASRVGNPEDVHIGALGGGYGVFRSLAGSTSETFLIPAYSSLSHQPGVVPGGFINTTPGLSTSMNMTGLASSALYQTPNQLNPGFFQGQCSNINPTPVPHNMIPAPALAPSTTLAPLPGQNQIDPLSYLCGMSSNLESNSLMSNAVQGQDLGGGLGGVSNFTNLQPLGLQQPQPVQDYTLNSSALPTPPPALQNLRITVNNNNSEVIPFTQFGAIPHTTVQQTDQIQNCNANSATPMFDEFLLDDDPKLFSSSQNSCEYLEDIVGRFLTQVSGGMQTAVEEEMNLDQTFGDY